MTTAKQTTAQAEMDLKFSWISFKPDWRKNRNEMDRYLEAVTSRKNEVLITTNFVFIP